MTTAILWVPKGVAKTVPAMAEPPSIEEILKSGLLAKCNDMDAYLKDKDNNSKEDEDMTIRPDDHLVVCANNDDDVSSLKMDELLPSVVLDGITEIRKKLLKKYIKYKKDSHIDSGLVLAWNKEYRNMLASASADQLVKVQAVAWNPFAPQILLSGSFNQTVCLKDGRKPSHSGFKFPDSAEVESLAWDPHSEHSFMVSLENGTVTSFDICAASADLTSETKPSFTIHAHDKAVSSMSFNPLVPDIKLWDLSNNQPSCIASRNPNAAAVFSVSFSDACPFLLAIGGSKGKLQLWDISSEDVLLMKYGKCVAEIKNRTLLGLRTEEGQAVFGGITIANHLLQWPL